MDPGLQSAAPDPEPSIFDTLKTTRSNRISELLLHESSTLHPEVPQQMEENREMKDRILHTIEDLLDDGAKIRARVSIRIWGFCFFFFFPAIKFSIRAFAVSCLNKNEG